MLVHLTLAAVVSFVLAAQAVRQPPTAPPLKRAKFETDADQFGALQRGAQP